MHKWVPEKPTPTPPTPPSLLRQDAPNDDEARAWLLELEAEVEQAALAMVRLWSKIHDMKKEG